MVRRVPVFVLLVVLRSASYCDVAIPIQGQIDDAIASMAWAVITDMPQYITADSIQLCKIRITELTAMIGGSADDDIVVSIHRGWNIVLPYPRFDAFCPKRVSSSSRVFDRH